MVPLREGPRYWNQGLPPTSGTQSLSPPAGRVDDSFKLDAGLALNLVVFFLKESCSRGGGEGIKAGGWTALCRLLLSLPCGPLSKMRLPETWVLD